MRGTALQTPRSVKKEGEEVLQAPEWRFPAAREDQVVPLQSMGNHVRTHIYSAAHGGPHAAAGGYALKNCRL